MWIWNFGNFSFSLISSQLTVHIVHKPVFRYTFWVFSFVLLNNFLCSIVQIHVNNIIEYKQSFSLYRKTGSTKYVDFWNLSLYYSVRWIIIEFLYIWLQQFSCADRNISNYLSKNGVPNLSKSMSWISIYI